MELLREELELVPQELDERELGLLLRDELERLTLDRGLLLRDELDRFTLDRFTLERLDGDEVRAELADDRLLDLVTELLERALDDGFEELLLYCGVLR